MGAPSKKSKLKPNTSNEKHKSMNYEKEKASIRANEKTNENLDKNENEVNIQEKRKSFARKLSTAEFYSKGIDTSNENDLNGSGNNNQIINTDKISSAPFENEDLNETLVENQSNANILKDGQNRIAILQSYDSYPDGDTKDMLASIIENEQKIDS